MNKSELVEVVAGQASLPRGEALRFVDTVLNILVEGIAKDGKVTLSGFGTFVRKHRSPRTGINPATKAVMEIKASATCGFRPSSILRQRLGCETVVADK